MQEGRQHVEKWEAQVKARLLNKLSLSDYIFKICTIFHSKYPPLSTLIFINPDLPSY